MQHAPEGGFKANVIRVFQDGDYVFTHTEYDFFGPKAGFDVFRFENGLIVEHWDNLLEVQKPNPSSRTQFDGATELKDLSKTEANKKVITDFIGLNLGFKTLQFDCSTLSNMKSCAFLNIKTLECLLEEV